LIVEFCLLLDFAYSFLVSPFLFFKFSFLIKKFIFI